MPIQEFLASASFSSTIRDMDKTQQNPGLAAAIALYPTLKAFAAAIGVRYQVVQQWLANGVPAEYCPRIERMTEGAVRSELLNSKVDWAYIRSSGAIVEAIPHP